MMNVETPIRAVPSDRVAAVRQFNRFHTRLVGALNDRMLASSFALPQVRVLYELAHADGLSAADLARVLGMDAGYLSRLITGLEADGLISRTPSPSNAKRLTLALTEKGRATSAALEEASAQEVTALLAKLPDTEQRQVVGAMQRIQRLVGGPPTDAPFILRDPEPGDLGWIVHRQATLYRQEYGWDWTCEALLAEIAGAFIRTYDPSAERCWVAEREGEIVGSVFAVRDTAEVAKLRLLYVEPSARGIGLGRRLVDECIRFARAKRYARLTLWTNDVLVAALRLYQAAGFRPVAEERYRSFGHHLVGQNWELDL